MNIPWAPTPLGPDEVFKLIPGHIITQAELNEWEQANILEAEMWLNSTFHSSYNPLTTRYNKAEIYSDHNQSPKIQALLEVSFIKQIHKRMFNKTWRWAGQFRKTDKNIGID